MTAKDFVALADYLRGEDCPENVLTALCAFRKSRNPRFSEFTFREYLAGRCGPRGGKLPKSDNEKFADRIDKMLHA